MVKVAVRAIELSVELAAGYECPRAILQSVRAAGSADGGYARLVGISTYLQRLREQIGHELLLLPGVAVLPWDEDGRLLLARERQSGLWQTVGGSMEPDESPHDAAVREAREEAGVTVRIDRIRTVVGGRQFQMNYPNGDLVSYVSTVFDAHVVEGEPRPDGDETSEVAWFTVGELRQARLTPFTLALFAAADIGGPASA